MEEKFGPESKFAKDMEAKFGPDSQFAKDMEAKFGPDSQFAKDMQAKFGPDSQFAKDMQAKLGADVDPFAKSGDSKKDGVRQSRQKSRGDAEVTAKVHADLAKRLADKSQVDADRAKRKAEARAEARPRADSDRKARRIEALEAKINALMDELKQLKSEGANAGSE